MIERRRPGAPAAFIPYLMAGDPDMATSEAMLHALTDCGAACIELGVPYSDPLADGPTIAAAGQRALAGGTTLAGVLGLAARARGAGAAPILLFSYYNPIDRYGLERFARDARAAGIAGAIVPDLPLEESQPLREALRALGLVMPLFVAPPTTLERARRLCEAASGFVYVVARLGVTGGSRGFEGESLNARIEALHGVTDKPLALGFGIREPEEVQLASALADAVIVGSALIEAYAQCSKGEAVERVRAAARRLQLACAPSGVG